MHRIHILLDYTAFGFVKYVTVGQDAWAGTIDSSLTTAFCISEF